MTVEKPGIEPASCRLGYLLCHQATQSTNESLAAVAAVDIYHCVCVASYIKIDTLHATVLLATVDSVVSY